MGASAEAHYSEALGLLREGSGVEGPLGATLFCNRAHVRHQCGDMIGAAADATEALKVIDNNGDEKMRVKALYRRGLARETLGELADASADINLALKAAPTNEGILAAARRIKEVLPKEPAQKKQNPEWVPFLSFHSVDVLDVADSADFPKRLRCYSEHSENPVVRFINGMG